jgi:hypothetical protein
MWVALEQNNTEHAEPLVLGAFAFRSFVRVEDIRPV